MTARITFKQRRSAGFGDQQREQAAGFGNPARAAAGPSRRIWQSGASNGDEPPDLTIRREQ
ncbi:hypothetical protein QUF72_21205 [Desulfobacterales bacterium HSG2]|nr:hypothetical protein [Desulfobacterales bacterium HSG2]